MHNSYSELENSAHNGCPLCRILVGTQEGCLLDWGEEVRDTQPIYLRRCEEFSERMVAVCHGYEEKKNVYFSCIPDFWATRATPSIPNEVELMTIWITNCRTSHPKCSNAKAYTPTRLLDLKAFGDSEDIRLVVLEEKVGVEYVALSYCWGPPETHSLTATQETLSDRLEKIPFAYLSRTFKDTIETTRKLGIRYLWIDALCIVQEDAEDWFRECSSMAAVYGNAVCTLAALSASDGTEGCRINAKRLDRDMWGQLVSKKRENLDITCGGNRIRICADDFMVWDDEYSNHNNPLRRRAWTMQERLLSTRNISFSTDILLWECKTIKASSELPWTFIEPEKRTGTVYAWPMRLNANEDKASAEKRDEWFKIVEDYSSRNLTCPTDKLPALSGVAFKFQSENRPGCKGTYTGRFAGGVADRLRYCVRS